LASNKKGVIKSPTVIMYANPVYKEDVCAVCLSPSVLFERYSEAAMVYETAIPVTNPAMATMQVS